MPKECFENAKRKRKMEREFVHDISISFQKERNDKRTVSESGR
jgi:hypothetical protein